MKFIVPSDEQNVPGGFVVRPVSQWNKRSHRKEKPTREDMVIQTDWDYPGLASSMGWRACECGGTDGTVDCEKCGRVADRMMAEAYDWIRAHMNEKFDDPGYFI